MAGSDNLIPLNKRTKEEQKAITTAGGIASGESRRARKTLKEELLLLLSEGDTQKSVTVALLQKAMDGDVKAFEVLRDTIGEKPVDKVENKNVDIVIDLGDLEDAD
jgi:hypothetical protein